MSDKPATPADRFTKWTVRLLALIGVLGCLALIFLVVSVSGMFSRRHQPARVEATDAREVFTVGDVQRIPGGNLLRMDVRSSDGRGGGLSSGPYSGSGNDQRNVIFLDSVSGQSRHLLRDNKRHIEEFTLFPNNRSEDALTEMVEATQSGKGEPAPRWYLLLVEQADGGRYDLIVGDVVGERQAMALSGIDGLDSATMLDPSHLALVLRDHRKLFYRTLDMTSFKATPAQPIAID